MNKVTQSIYKNAVDNLNKHSVNGTGVISNLPGVIKKDVKWCLSGNNLCFEMTAMYPQAITAGSTLATFTLPKWISDKIIKIQENVVDLLNYSLATNDGGFTTTILLVELVNNTLSFKSANGIAASSETIIAKIRYNILLS